MTKLGISMGMGNSTNISTKATALSMAVTTRERVVILALRGEERV